MEKNIPIFQNPDIEGRNIDIPGNSTGVLLIHGFTATTAEVHWLAEDIRKKGFTVFAPLLPGHGTDPQDLNRRKMPDWLECVEDAYAYLEKKCKSVIVGGESMGAVLSLYLAERHPEIQALLIYSPAIHVRRMRISGIMKWFRPILVKSNYDPQDKDWQGYNVYPVKAAHEFYKLQRLVERDLKAVRQPALILHGIYDKTIDEDCGEFVYRNISSEQKEYRLMENSGHVMLLGNEFEVISQMTSRFLKSINILDEVIGL